MGHPHGTEASTAEKALSIVPHITGLLSFWGSCSILYDIIMRYRHKKRVTSYHRLLLGISVYDAVCSFSLGLSTWPIPRGTEGIYAAVGTTQTCTAQGFFNQLLLGSPLYNLMLAIYYLLIGKYNKSDEDISMKYEKYMHIIANTIAISIAVAGLPLTLYNNANLWCWIAAYPEGSEGFNGHEHGDEECERGHGAWMYRWIFFYAPLWAIIVSITFIMILLTQSIRLEEKHYIELMRCEDVNSPDSNRPTGGVEESTETKSSRQNNIIRPIPEERAIGNEESATTKASSSNYIRPAPPPQAFKLERSRKMFYQALFYVGAFYLTWWAPTINRLIQMANGESYYFFMLATAVFAPLQGFFNFIVYRHGTCIA